MGATRQQARDIAAGGVAGKAALDAIGFGTTSTAAELNLLDGATAGVAVASKALVLGATKNIDTIDVTKDGLKIGGVAVTVTAAEANLLDTAVAGTAVASKAAVLGANKNLDTLRIAKDGFLIDATPMTCTAAELNKLDTVTATVAQFESLAKNGFIPLDITALREIAANAIQNLAAHGGLLASDSVPILQRTNGATDKGLRVSWVAADVAEIQFPPVALPPDALGSSDMTVHLLAKMSDTNDTPTIDVQVWDGIGDSEMGGNTGVLSDSLQELTVTLANANLTGHPLGFLNIGLVPAAHGSDALYLYAAWLEYTRNT